MRSVATGPSTKTGSPRATRRVRSSRLTPAARSSISGTPPPTRPLTSMMRGPSGVNLTSVCRHPVCTPRASDGLGGQVQDGRAALGVEGGGDEKPCLAEVFGRREAPGQGQVADDAVSDQAFDRHVAGVRVAVTGRIVGQVTLEDHVGAARAEGDEQILELGAVAGQEGVAAALGRAGFEDGGPPDLGLDGRELAWGLVGADEVAGRHVEAGVGQGPALAGLVGEGGGGCRAVEGQAQILSHTSQFDHAGVKVGGHAVGLPVGQGLERLLDVHAFEVDNGAEPVEEIGHLAHPRHGRVDHPQQVADAGGRFGQLHHRNAARPVAHRHQWPSPSGRGIHHVLSRSRPRRTPGRRRRPGGGCGARAGSG